MLYAGGAPSRELSWYANSKHIAEQRLTAMADKLRWAFFRPTAVYRPGDKELKPLFDWMLRGLLATTPCTRYTALFLPSPIFTTMAAWLSHRKLYNANL